jgi:glycosyltransferase involved in cell wall biosynthesis
MTSEGGRTANVVMVGPFGLRLRGTMGVRALPMAKALAARGYTVAVLLPPWRNPQDAGRCWEEDGVAVENICLPPGIPALFHVLTAFRLARRALALRPDVVHFFKPKAYSGLTHWLLARLPRARRPRLVVDTDDWEGPGGWNEISGYSSFQRRFFTWQERWGLTHANAITVASRTLESLVWALGVCSERVFYVPNGIGYRELDAASCGADTDAGYPASGARVQTILLYTRFFEFSLSRVVDVLRRVRERVPQARLLVVGKGLSAEEDEMLALVQRAGLTDAVEYVGLVESAALPGYFARADVAIYPFDDTLVNRAKCAVKLRDLLAAGVPVVAEDVGQNREMIRHGETGWLVESGDVASFASAVVRLLGDAQLRARLGQAAARDVRERLAWDRLVRTVEKAYGMDEVGS